MDGRTVDGQWNVDTVDRDDDDDLGFRALQQRSCMAPIRWIVDGGSKTVEGRAVDDGKLTVEGWTVDIQ